MSSVQSAKLLAGKIVRTNAAYRPAPSLVYFPGLTSKPWHDAGAFEFAKDFEANFKKIREEYWQLRRSYGERDDYVKQKDEHTLSQGEWKWMNYIEAGKVVNHDVFEKHCPTLVQLMHESVGASLMTKTPFSYTFFSTMSPGASIAPHYGASNLKLRCHFPIEVPEEAFLRVAGDPRPWTPGKMVIFDDSYEHEAANLSLDRERVILLMDIWHPDLVPAEIA